MELFAKLTDHLFSEFQDLERAFEDRDAVAFRQVGLLAWRARNLLELMVWAKYFSTNRDNARRLYEEAGRDTYDVYQLFLTWGRDNNQPQDWVERIEQGRAELVQRAAGRGIDDLSSPYMRLIQAASACDSEEHFRYWNKLLSKFVHPTAMQIVIPPDDPGIPGRQRFLMGIGCLFFTHAVSALEGVEFQD